MLLALYLMLAGIAAGTGYLTLSRRSPEIVYSILFLTSSVITGLSSLNVEVASAGSLLETSSVLLAGFWMLVALVALMFVIDIGLNEARDR